MDNRQFNLTTDPWIKVITVNDNQEQMVSLIDLFTHAQDYRQLAGDMRSQNLAILRLLLAILTTVYSRFDATGEAYSWLKTSGTSPQDLEVDDDEFTKDDSTEDLLETWQQLNQAGHFTQSVTRYLEFFADRFDFFGERPFYQVTTADYDALVPKNKAIAAGKGKVAVKQLNRRISESNHTPAIFAPKTGAAKNDMSLDELIRWIITYQNFTGVTDKTKIVTEESFSNAAGWLYRLNPVFAQGETLFTTLMLNLVLSDSRNDYACPKPVWEYATVSDYIAERKREILPDNLPEIYTAWSRILHIEWDENQRPTIFSAGIPMFSSDSAFIEPMTTWRFDKKTNAYRPAIKGLRSLGIAMWRNFGAYINVHRADDRQEPELVVWLRTLKEQNLLAHNHPLVLNSVALISDGNATSQAPAVEVGDDMQMQADVLFDSGQQDYWPTRIEEAIDFTQTVGDDYYHFAKDIAQIRNVDGRLFAGQMSAKFYERLNTPFKMWLEGLTSQDDRDEKIMAWKTQLKMLTVAAVDEELQASSPRDMRGVSGKTGPLNIFTAKSHLMYNLRLHLDL